MTFAGPDERIEALQRNVLENPFSENLFWKKGDFPRIFPQLTLVRSEKMTDPLCQEFRRNRNEGKFSENHAGK